MRRGGRQQYCAARSPCTARWIPRDNATALVCPQSGALSPLTVLPPNPHVHHQTFLQQRQGLSACVEDLGNARVRSSSVPCHITLPMLPQAHFFSRRPVSESLPLYTPHFALTTGAPPPAAALGSVHTVPLPVLLINTPPNRQEQTPPAAPFPSNPLPFPSIIYLNIKMSLSLIYMRKKGCNNEDVD